MAAGTTCPHRSIGNEWLLNKKEAFYPEGKLLVRCPCKLSGAFNQRYERRAVTGWEGEQDEHE